MTQASNSNWIDKFKAKWKYVAGIGLFIGGLAAFLNNIKDIRSFFEGPEQGLQIVDVSFKESKEQKLSKYLTLTPFDTIDIIIRNIGEKVHVIKRIDLVVKNAWILRAGREVRYQRLWPADTFQVIIDAAAPPPKKISVPASIQIKPNNAEKFYVSVWAQPPHAADLIVYNADLEIAYDEYDQKVKKQNLLIGSGLDLKWFVNEKNKYIFSSPNRPWRQLHQENLRLIKQIDSMNGLYNPIARNAISYIKGEHPFSDSLNSFYIKQLELFKSKGPLYGPRRQ